MRCRAIPSLSAAVLLVSALLGVSCATPSTTTDGSVIWRQPKQQLLASSMERRPEPGWRLSVTDLGLPNANSADTAESRFAAPDDVFDPSSLVGNVGDRAYFLARSAETTGTRSWLTGVDVSEGTPLFAPISLEVAEIPPRCLMNGPRTVLCVRADEDLRKPIDGAFAWVIDTDQGVVSYFGPTQLSAGGLVQVGIYAVAQDYVNGVHGVGARAETTWLVPGSGSVDTMSRPTDGSTPPPFGVQTAAGRGNDRQIVFSLVDGAVVDPGASPGQRQLGARVYPGGFAIELTSEPNANLYSPQEIVFFDEKGIRVSNVGLPEKKGAQLFLPSPDIPIVASRDESIVYGVNGTPIAQIPPIEFHSDVRLIGSSLFMHGKDKIGVPHQRRYDLRTGEEGKPCEFDFGTRFVGSDATVGVFRVLDAPDVPLIAKGRDLSTCETVWSLSGDNGSYAELWQINTTLVRLSDDGTELMSLVAPHE